MLKKTFHILIISIIALNLTGGWVFASSLDCGRQCCDNGGQSDTSSLETSSCCYLDEVTCGFGTGHHQQLLDKAICHHAGTRKVPTQGGPDLTSPIFPDAPTLRYSISPPSAVLAKTLPVYLSNATILC